MGQCEVSTEVPLCFVSWKPFSLHLVAHPVGIGSNCRNTSKGQKENKALASSPKDGTIAQRGHMGLLGEGSMAAQRQSGHHGHLGKHSVCLLFML